VTKHFPGYNVAGNSDNEVVVSRESLAGVTARMQPFFKVQNVSAIMMVSIIVVFVFYSFIYNRLEFDSICCL
jgi:beta-glucosidase-like glycosyl hydrolase